MADQSASLFGSGCIRPGDLKITMGTGTFLNVNTGAKPHASISGNILKIMLINIDLNIPFCTIGLYPLIGWRIDDEIVYAVEGASNDTGVLIEWAKKIGKSIFYSKMYDLRRATRTLKMQLVLGIINSADETASIANSVDDSDGVYFVPAFSGLQVRAIFFLRNTVRGKNEWTLFKIEY